MSTAARFTGETALVTGGARGIGAATAARLAAEGADVVVADFDLDAAEQTAAAIGGRAVRCDVTSRADVEAAVEAAAGRRAGSTSSSPARGSCATTSSTS